MWTTAGVALSKAALPEVPLPFLAFSPDGASLLVASPRCLLRRRITRACFSACISDPVWPLGPDGTRWNPLEPAGTCCNLLEPAENPLRPGAFRAARRSSAQL